MDFLEHEETQRRVDYSFGDHSGVLGGVPNAYMKKANLGNKEFCEWAKHFEGTHMNLFIDNIRLYKRPLHYSDWMHCKPISAQDREWLNQFADEDLLELCSQYPRNRFNIFTAFEDTPLDPYIWDRIPDNVLAINAANAVVFGWKVHPFPHGIERVMYPGYNHHQLLKEAVANPLPSPTGKPLLLVCHREDTGDRGGLRPLFEGKPWATVAPHLEYPDYLKAIQNHKFVLCPSGNGIESARNWETLYLKRVPIFKNHQYLKEMFKDFPALFVGDFSEVTEQLLKDNEHLFEEVRDMNKLTLSYWFKKAHETI